MPAFAESIDQLVYQAHFGTPVEQTQAHHQIRTLAANQGALPSSTHPLYAARGKGLIASDTFTVPACNLRGLSYHTAQAAFTAAQQLEVGLVIFELARSEMKYTHQTPAQLVSSVLGAAVKTNWHGPVFIQGDHYQPKAAAPGQIKNGEEEAIEQLIEDSIQAGIYNLDLDGSTLVDVAQPTEYDQQRPNFLYTAQMIKVIRSLQPTGIPISIGCEISEVGTHLSKSSQLAAFMTGLRDEGDITENDYPVKVAIETGTAHGGRVNPDGTAAPMKVEFDTLKAISIVARHKYGMAGAVQHGASTLDRATFARFPQAEACEIHLSTGFQNTILDHSAFPRQLLTDMYAWCDEQCAEDRKSDWTPAQFYVKTRKKAWGAFKQATWDLPIENLALIQNTLKQECLFYFESLGVTRSQELVQNMHHL